MEEAAGWLYQNPTVESFTLNHASFMFRLFVVSPLLVFLAGCFLVLTRLPGSTQVNICCRCRGEENAHFCSDVHFHPFLSRPQIHPCSSLPPTRCLSSTQQSDGSLCQTRTSTGLWEVWEEIRTTCSPKHLIYVVSVVCRFRVERLNIKKYAKL